MDSTVCTDPSLAVLNNHDHQANSGNTSNPDNINTRHFRRILVTSGSSRLAARQTELVFRLIYGYCLRRGMKGSFVRPPSVLFSQHDFLNKFLADAVETFNGTHVTSSCKFDQLNGHESEASFDEALRLLSSVGLVDVRSPSSVALFLFSILDLRPSRVRQFLGLSANRNVLHEYMALLPFEQSTFDDSLQIMVNLLEVPSEFVVLSTFLEEFALSWTTQNPGVISNLSAAVLLATTLMMMSSTEDGRTSLQPMRRAEFSKLFRPLLESQQISSDEWLKALYDRVTVNRIVFPSKKAPSTGSSPRTFSEIYSSSSQLSPRSGELEANPHNNGEIACLPTAPSFSQKPSNLSLSLSFTTITKTPSMRMSSVISSASSRPNPQYTHSPGIFRLRLAVDLPSKATSLIAEARRRVIEVELVDAPFNPSDKEILQGDAFICLYDPDIRSSFDAILRVRRNISIAKRRAQLASMQISSVHVVLTAVHDGHHSLPYNQREYIDGEDEPVPEDLVAIAVNEFSVPHFTVNLDAGPTPNIETDPTLIPLYTLLLRLVEAQALQLSVNAAQPSSSLSSSSSASSLTQLRNPRKMFQSPSDESSDHQGM